MGFCAGCGAGEHVPSDRVAGVEGAATSLQVAPVWREKLQEDKAVIQRC